MSKLSDQDKFDIHEDYKYGLGSQQQLAEDYGVSRATIRRVLQEMELAEKSIVDQPVTHGPGPDSTRAGPDWDDGLAHIQHFDYEALGWDDYEEDKGPPWYIVVAVWIILLALVAFTGGVLYYGFGS